MPFLFPLDRPHRHVTLVHAVPNPPQPLLRFPDPGETASVVADTFPELLFMVCQSLSGTFLRDGVLETKLVSFHA